MSEEKQFWEWCCEQFREPSEPSHATANRLKLHVMRGVADRERYTKLAMAISEAVENNESRSLQDRS